MPNPARADGCSRLFLTAWLVGWTLIVGLFDAFAGWALFQQFRALTYPTAPGVITRSAVQRERDDEGDVSYSLTISYTYEVDGRTYTGTRYSYADGSSNRAVWHEVATELPVGAAVRVYHDPTDPSESLLRPGLSGFHLWCLWFFAPFNAIAVIGWSLFLRGRPTFDPSDPRTVARTDDGWRVRLPVWPRVTVFAAILLGLSVPAIFVGGIPLEMNPPALLSGWLTVAAVVFAASTAAAWRLHLEIDARARVVRFPGGEAPFAAVTDVTVAPDVFGGAPEYHCELARADRPARVATYRTEADAAALAVWLRERLGLKAVERAAR